MAQVTAKQREKTEQRTGDSSYPMETAAQIRSAIKLRHHGKSKTAGEVLNMASRAVSRLLKAGKISAETADQLREAIANAREKDKDMGRSMSSFLFTELQDDALTDGRAFDGVAFGVFRDMLGREIELDADDAADYVANTRAAIEATTTESGELVGLPIDAQGHDKGDGAGWIIGVELVEGVIRFIPKWTEIGRELISKGIRRFFSATIDVSNKVVLGGTLTNWPATRDERNRVMLRPIELESGLYTVETLEQEPVETAPLDISGDEDMAEEVEVLEDNGVTVVTKDPPAQAQPTPELMADVLAEFTEAGKREPHELAIAIEKRANQIAQNRVRQMLEQREQTWQITQLAAKFTGGAKYALPLTVVELTNFLESLNPDQFRVARELFDKITTSGLVEFEEIGHGRRLIKQRLPEIYHDGLKSALAAGHTVNEFFELAELGDPGQYDLSQFEGGK